MLDPAIFFRCHKNFIININHVEKVLPYADRAYKEKKFFPGAPA